MGSSLRRKWLNSDDVMNLMKLVHSVFPIADTSIGNHTIRLVGDDLELTIVRSLDTPNGPVPLFWPIIFNNEVITPELLEEIKRNIQSEEIKILESNGVPYRG